MPQDGKYRWVPFWGAAVRNVKSATGMACKLLQDLARTRRLLKWQGVADGVSQFCEMGHQLEK